MDERLWLLSTAYNTGVECLQFVVSSFWVWLTLSQVRGSASLTDEAKRWFECATVLCRFVPDGRPRAEKVCPMTTLKLVHNAAPPWSCLDIESLHRTIDALRRPTHPFTFGRLRTVVRCRRCIFPVSRRACRSCGGCIYIYLAAMPSTSSLLFAVISESVQ